MTIAVMQPYFFPYLGYFQLINIVDKFVLYDDVNYINRGWINRNNFLINGKKHLITIPLKNASQNKKICDIELNFDERWRNKTIKSFEFSYKKAPYYNEVISIIKHVLHINLNTISELNHSSIEQIIKYLNIKTEIIYSSSIYNNENLHGQERILDICKKEKANQYINPIGGIELYDKKAFSQNGIQLNFLKTNIISYKQYDNEFIPHLSIIDILMFNSQSEIKKLLNRYVLT